MALRFFLAVLPVAGTVHANDMRPRDARPADADAAAACEAAILHAEGQYRLPRGMLFAIGLAESGRVDAASHRARPWPWAVQAGDKSLYFETKNEAIDWVQNARAKGTASIDTGCLQINLFFHPQAFATLEAAFDPESNVDYAARFLVKLHEETNDWAQAIGFYHSRTPALALPYQQHVQVTMGLRPTSGVGLEAGAPPREESVAAQLARAWSATSEPVAPVIGSFTANTWSTLLQAPVQNAATSRLSRRAVRTRRVVTALANSLEIDHAANIP